MEIKKLTTNDLFTLVTKEIIKGARVPDAALKYNATADSVSVSAADSGDYPDTFRDTSLSEIRSGFYVEADSPSSTYVVVKLKQDSNHIGTKKGVVYSALASEHRVQVPMDGVARVWYLNVTQDGNFNFDLANMPEKLAIAKIVIPSEHTAVIVDDMDDDNYSGYIISGRDLLFENRFEIDDETISELRNIISEVLADNLIGNIMLSEFVKVVNTQGSVEMNSSDILVKDDSGNVLSKFNKNGVYFYDAEGKEKARFTGEDARIGNILITQNTLESTNYSEGVAGFKISSDGLVIAQQGLIGGWDINATTLSSTDNRVVLNSSGKISVTNDVSYKLNLYPSGLTITAKMVVSLDNFTPDDEKYIKDVVIKTTDVTPTVISDTWYKYGAKTGRFIKNEAYANDPSFPDNITISYTVVEVGDITPIETQYADEPYTFTLQESAVGLIDMDGTVDAEYVKNLIVGSADIINAAITSAHIQDLAVTSAKIQNLSADKITSGAIESEIIVVGTDITPNTGVFLNGIDNNIVVKDGTYDRVTLGNTGNDYGLSCRNSAGVQTINIGEVLGAVKQLIEKSESGPTTIHGDPLWDEIISQDITRSIAGGITLVIFNTTFQLAVHHLAGSGQIIYKLYVNEVEEYTRYETVAVDGYLITSSYSTVSSFVILTLDSGVSTIKIKAQSELFGDALVVYAQQSSFQLMELAL